MATALILALALLATDATATSTGGEPLPPGAPTDEYQLAGWCYGALHEYLDIYDRVKPDLVDIDRMWGSSVKEAEPYASDITAARAELHVLADALEAAEKASPRPIAPEGAAAIKMGQSIWALAEARPHRELARAWLTWGLPDRCGANARTLASKASLLGKALTYNNNPDAGATPMAPAPSGPMTIRPIAPVVSATPDADRPPPLGLQSAPTPVATEPPPEPSAEPAMAAAAPRPEPTPTDVATAAPKPTVVVEAPAPAPAPSAPTPKPPPAQTDESSEPVL